MNSILTLTVDQSEKIVCIRKILQIICILEGYSHRDIELTILAYYCLYGVTGRAEYLVKKDYMSGRTEEYQSKIIYNTRYKLKKLGLLVTDAYTFDVSVRPDLQKQFQSPDNPILTILKFNYQPEEDSLTLAQTKTHELEGSAN